MKLLLLLFVEVPSVSHNHPSILTLAFPLSLPHFEWDIILWWFLPILSVGLLVHLDVSGDLQLRNYCAAAGNLELGSSMW